VSTNRREGWIMSGATMYFLSKVGTFSFPNALRTVVRSERQEETTMGSPRTRRGRHCHAVRRNRCGDFDRSENGGLLREQTWDGSARDLLD
jgi:hypothetical protein